MIKGLWEAIKGGVFSLPHKVEWYEPTDKIGDPAYLRTQIQNTFIVPKGIVDLFGGNGAGWEEAQELADTTKCDLIKANDGSWIFRSRI